jgi:enoyl-[acyl-carrier protein] reductase II
MLHTPLCDRLGISIPIVQAPIAPYTSPQLVAAVSNAGGLGSIGTALQSLDTVKRQVEQTQKLTSHPFAINFTNRTFNEELFSYVIREAKPKVISYALGIQANLLNGLMMLEFSLYNRFIQQNKHKRLLSLRLML